MFYLFRAGEAEWRQRSGSHYRCCQKQKRVLGAKDAAIKVTVSL